jgi:hypothetical protein
MIDLLYSITIATEDRMRKGIKDGIDKKVASGEIEKANRRLSFFSEGADMLHSFNPSDAELCGYIGQNYSNIRLFREFYKQLLIEIDAHRAETVSVLEMRKLTAINLFLFEKNTEILKLIMVSLFVVLTVLMIMNTGKGC